MRSLQILYVVLLLAFPIGFSKLHARVCVSSKLLEDCEVQPGDVLERSLSLSNMGETFDEVNLQIKDYTFNAKGQNYYLEPGSIERSNSKWISLEQNAVRVAPNSKSTINYKINIPKDKNLNGTYWSTILVEPISRAKKGAPQKKTCTVSVVIRYAIQVITTIKDTGEYDIKVLDKKIVTQNNKKYLKFILENHGTLASAPNVWAEIFTLQGEKKGVFNGSKTRVYPGTSCKHLIDLSGLDTGKYRSPYYFR